MKLVTKCPLGNTKKKRPPLRMPRKLRQWTRNNQGDGSALVKPVLNSIGKRARDTAARSATRSSDLRQKRKAAINQYPRENTLARTVRYLPMKSMERPYP